MNKEHLNKDGSLDMRYAENQHYSARKFRQGLLCAVVLGFLLACAGMVFIMRPRSVKENIFENVDTRQDYIDTQYPEKYFEHEVLPTPTPKPQTNKIVKVVYATNYTYMNHAGKPYYDDVIAELRMRYVNWQDAAELVAKESGFNPFIINPTSGACYLPQALPCAKMGCEGGDIDCQLDWQKEYIANKYGTVSKALQFWYAQEAKNGKGKGWY